ncbi:uncharacterized protein HMPREF1541_00561 [Cyphellophora europaea CBS 101466]|uniref:Uncharacterized protein n=1 Tax=Cyphellophora europaea (strain CBS 101466) TaxID=1220924 RepID=W2SCH0_CYPE1|nr:uncharacterized protein HMPREF1541_00561 [Cyphellophora europaea CBS 101466]ETN46377.1 hypothetical protein HMPREF1541_00561 [Cyphellophora europaea CBS 101466]
MSAAARLPICYYSEKHTLFTSAWWREVTQRDEFWADFSSKVNDTTLNRRMSVSIRTSFKQPKAFVGLRPEAPAVTTTTTKVSPLNAQASTSKLDTPREMNTVVKVECNDCGAFIATGTLCEGCSSSDPTYVEMAAPGTEYHREPNPATRSTSPIGKQPANPNEPGSESIITAEKPLQRTEVDDRTTDSANIANDATPHGHNRVQKLKLRVNAAPDTDSEASVEHQGPQAHHEDKVGTAAAQNLDADTEEATIKAEEVETTGEHIEAGKLGNEAKATNSEPDVTLQSELVDPNHSPHDRQSQQSINANVDRLIHVLHKGERHSIDASKIQETIVAGHKLCFAVIDGTPVQIDPANACEVAEATFDEGGDATTEIKIKIKTEEAEPKMELATAVLTAGRAKKQARCQVQGLSKAESIVLDSD